MNVTKSDLFYILMSIVVALFGVFAVSNVNTQVGLYGLLGLLGLAALMAIVIKPSLGANILVLAIFTNISDLLTKQSYPGIIKPLVVIVSVGLLIRYIYVGRIPILHPRTVRVEFFLLAYYMVTVSSFLVASNKDAAFAQILDMGKDIVLIYCIVFALREAQPWKQTTWLIIGITALLCSLSAYQLVTNNFEHTFFNLAAVQIQKVFDNSGTPRIAGPVNAPNVWGQILVAVSMLLVFRIIHEKHVLVKLAGSLMLGIIFYAVLNTFSRGAYLVLAIDVILVLFVFEKRFNPVFAFAGLGILILLLPFLPASYMERFSTLSFFADENGIYQDSALRLRSSEILTGFVMFAEHPILGVGTANYPANYQRYTQLVGLEYRARESQAHSLYVQVLAETGILGAITFFGMLYFLFEALNKACRRVERSPHLHEWLPWINAIRMALISYLLTSLFLHSAYIRYFWLLVAMALAGIQITDHLLSKSEKRISPEARR